MKLYNYAVVFVPFLSAISGNNNEYKSSSLKDVFPIEPGIRYSYIIDRSGASGDELYGSGSRDSGRVDYVVIDSSSSNDSTIIWNVIEIHDYTRTQSSNYSHLDTTFQVSDSLNLSISEKRVGNHELRCNGIVWEFPLGHIRNEKGESVFRYFDTSECAMAWNWQNQSAIVAYGSGTDSIHLSTKSGFYKRYFHENWYSGYLWGNTTVSIYSLHDPITSVTEEKHIPFSISLEQNYPNPFNPNTTIVFNLNKSSLVTLKVYNLLGKEIVTLANGYFIRGEHLVKWNADNLPTGIYFYKLSTQGNSEIKKMLLLK